MNIQKTLSNIGLSDSEIRLYLSLLKLKSASVSELSADTKIKRTTIYPFLESLGAKGLIKITGDYYKRQAQILDPNLLIEFAKKEKEKVSKSINELTLNINSLTKNYLNKLDDVEIRYFEGVEECKKMFLEILDVKGDLIGYSSWRKYEFLGEKWCKDFFDEVFDLPDFNIERLIVSATNHNLFHAQEYVKEDIFDKIWCCKFIEAQKEFINSDTYLFNDTKIVLSFLNVKPNGILIRNKDLVYSEKAIFETLYKNVALRFEDYVKKHKIDLKKLKHE